MTKLDDALSKLKSTKNNAIALADPTQAIDESEWAFFQTIVDSINALTSTHNTEPVETKPTEVVNSQELESAIARAEQAEAVAQQAVVDENKDVIEAIQAQQPVSEAANVSPAPTLAPQKAE